MFLNAIVDFLIVAFAIFLIVRAVNRWQAPKTVVDAPKRRECPLCLSSIPARATKCPHCTSVVAAA